MSSLFLDGSEVRRSWCEKTTQDDTGRLRAPREWRTCQLEECPWKLFERKVLFDDDDVPRKYALCRANAIHKRFV